MCGQFVVRVASLLSSIPQVGQSAVAPYNAAFCAVASHIAALPSVLLRCLELHGTVVAVVAELPQTPEDDLRSARAVRGKRNSGCMSVGSYSYGGLGGGRGGGGGWYACGTMPRGLVACRRMPEHFPSAR